MIILRGHHLELFKGYLNSLQSDYSRQCKESAIITSAIQDGHSKKMGLNIIDVLKRATDPTEKIKLVDTLDDICDACNSKNLRKCKEFIPYGVSCASADRGSLHFYKLQKRVYTSKTIQAKIQKHDFD